MRYHMYYVSCFFQEEAAHINIVSNQSQHEAWITLTQHGRQ